MGLNFGEPGEVESYARNLNIPLTNSTSICVSMDMISSGGIFNDNPLNYSVPLLLLQSSVSSGCILLIYKLLKPFGQCLIVSQLLAGLILGQTLLNLNTSISKVIFPLRSFIMIDLFAQMGFVLHLFLIGVQMDPWILKKINAKIFAIGLLSSILAMVLSCTSSIILLKSVHMNLNVKASLPLVAQSEAAFSFPMIAQFLLELKIINTEFGRVALSSSMISGVCSFIGVTLTFLTHQTGGETFKIFTTITNAALFGVFIFFAIRPAVLWLLRREGDQTYYLAVVFLVVLVIAYFGECIGVNVNIGPLFLGLIIPSEPPIGPMLLQKLDFITFWMFMPFIFVKAGLMANISAIKFNNYIILQYVAIMAAIGKFLGAFLPALFYPKMTMREAVALGLVMTVQGVLELGMFKMLVAQNMIDKEAFSVTGISMMLITGAITPMVRHLYNPTKKYSAYTRTMMQLKPNADLRVMVCIHHQEDVPATINLLDALNCTPKSHIGVYLLHFIELVGRATPLLITHNQTKGHTSKAADSSQSIINAFRYYEHNNSGLVSLHPFTAISHSKTMHDNVCEIAYNKKTSLILIPYYKKFSIDGELKLFKNANKIAINNTLQYAPCSVAILVDRGLVKTPKTIMESWTVYHVAILFLGGADDWEALALGARMAGHPNINLTIIRLLHNINTEDGDIERELDDEVLSGFTQNVAENCRVMYIEELVMDSSETVAVIRSLANKYELIIAGRYHNNRSPLVLGLADWHEHTELGAVGDLLVSAEFMGKTTILVVQQHTNESHKNCEEEFGFKQPREERLSAKKTCKISRKEIL